MRRHREVTSHISAPQRLLVMCRNYSGYLHDRLYNIAVRLWLVSAYG